MAAGRSHESQHEVKTAIFVIIYQEMPPAAIFFIDNLFRLANSTKNLHLEIQYSGQIMHKQGRNHT